MKYYKILFGLRDIKTKILTRKCLSITVSGATFFFEASFARTLFYVGFPILRLITQPKIKDHDYKVFFNIHVKYFTEVISIRLY